MHLILQALILGATLAMDALSISISKALATQKIKISNALKISLVFGLFQAVMPLIGYLVGSQFYLLIKDFFGFVSFAILAFLGGKMIYEHSKCEEDEHSGIITIKELIILGIATSIDALAVGFIFSGNAFLLVLLNCLIIGLITFAICFIGYIFGSKIGCVVGNKGELIGGIVLIMLGIKFLIECFI
ncbi:MAG: manganese efflux pump [Clostridia bacterium]|nr:manganese efflux pump [Clostridia bacterium]